MISRPVNAKKWAAWRRRLARFAVAAVDRSVLRRGGRLGGFVLSLAEEDCGRGWEREQTGLVFVRRQGLCSRDPGGVAHAGRRVARRNAIAGAGRRRPLAAGGDRGDCLGRCAS